jgi:predicted esterase YcpF (UPF0227 family)
MRYLKLFEDYRKKPVILYLHGLDGHLKEANKDIVDKFDVQYMGIATNYRLSPVWDTISEMKIDGVIGHSLGGYLAYYLSNYKKIPCLMFMPCFDDEILKIQPVPEEVKKLPMYAEKITVVGELDVDVNKEIQQNYIKDTDVHLVKVDHHVTTDIFSEYSKMFCEKYF